MAAPPAGGPASRRPLARAVAVLALVAAAAGCSGSSGSSLVPSSSGSGSASSSGPDGPGEKGVAPDTDAPTPPTASPTSPAASSSRTSTPAAGLRDFRDVTFTVPSGFAVTTAYSPITPLESDYRTHFVAPTSATDTKEVIGLAVYTLPAAATVTSRTDQVALIKAFNTRAKAVVGSSGISRAASMIDGVPAYTETATETGNAGSVTYIAYWAFGTHHFLQYTCQLGATSGVAALAVACGTTLASLRLT